MLFTWNNEQAGCAKITWLTNETLHTQRQLCLNCSRIAQCIVLEPLVPPPQLLRQKQRPWLCERLFTNPSHKDLKASEIAWSLKKVTLCGGMPPLFNLRFSEHTTQTKSTWMLNDQGTKGGLYVRYGPTGKNQGFAFYSTKIHDYVVIYICCIYTPI